MIQIDHIREGLKSLKENNFTSVFPAVAFSYPIWRGVEISEEGKTKMVWPEYLNSRSQDLQKIYHDAGQWYWFNTDYMNGWAWPDNTGSIVLSEAEVQDIDTITDWKLAEMKFKLLHEK